jgi:MFS family permease
MSQPPEPVYSRRTFLGLAGDMFFFGVGASFAGQATVIPSFLATLTSSAPLIGLASTLLTGGWLIPQLFAANRLAGLTHRKAAVVIPAVVGRTIGLLLPLAIVILAPRRPEAMLAVFYVLYFAFYFVDGLASIAWLDILGRCLSVPARARLINLGSTLPGLAGIGAGILVGVILSEPRVPWPYNYALLFGICGVFWVLSLASFMFIHETPLAVVQPPLPWRSYFSRLAGVFRADPGFRRAVIMWIAFGGFGIAAPFYVIHGLEALRLPAASVGVFTSVQLVGGVVSSLLLGVIGERRGTRAVMRLWGWVSLAGPIIAIAASLLGRSLPGALLYVYAAVFIVVGMQGVAGMTGFLNWVLEWSPGSDRPLYIGVANTLTAVSLVMPLLGGWILEATSSWVALFIVALAGPVAGIVLLRRLPEPRHRGPAPVQ